MRILGRRGEQRIRVVLESRLRAVAMVDVLDAPARYSVSARRVGEALLFGAEGPVSLRSSQTPADGRAILLWRGDRLEPFDAVAGPLD